LQPALAKRWVMEDKLYKPIFHDRREAGRVLAHLLYDEYGGRSDVRVLALPRGGVPVGFEVARALAALLDVFVVRKLGVPGHEELALGAIATGGMRVVNEDIVRLLGIPEAVVDRVASQELQELERRESLYRGGRPALDVRGRCVLVDDGLATGATMRAAVQALRLRQPARVVVAVPVAPRSTCEELRQVADVVVCAATPEPFRSVGQWYEEFDQTTDEEVRQLLARAAAMLADSRGVHMAVPAQEEPQSQPHGPDESRPWGVR
jgi:predicted phosphoribosyltransferase